MAGHLPVVQVILEAGDLAPLDLWRCSPLHRAAEYGREEVFIHLLQQRADPQKADREGNSPLHWACTSGARLKPLELFI